MTVGKDFYRRLIIMAGVLITTMCLVQEQRIKAASASISFSAVEGDIRVGDEVSIELYLESGVPAGNFDGYITYDSDVLEYVSGPDCIAGSEGILKLSDYITESERNTRKYVLTFVATDKGFCALNMRGAPEVYEFETGYLMSVSCNPLVIEVMAPESAVSEAGLETLRISPGVLKPEFDMAVTEYETIVSYDTERLFISAVPLSDKASVGISGNDRLNVGQNRIVILVTAEDGTEKKYMIYAVREAEPVIGEPDEAGSVDDSETTGDKTEPDRQEEKWSFYATERDGELFLNTKTEYEICEHSDNISIPEGYDAVPIIVSGINITAYAPESDPESDYLLLILKKEGGSAGIYRYDRVEKTLQRYAGEGERMSSGDISPEQQQEREKRLSESYEESLSSITVFVAVLSGICALLVILVIRLLIKNHGINSDDNF